MVVDPSNCPVTTVPPLGREVCTGFAEFAEFPGMVGEAVGQ